MEQNLKDRSEVCPLPPGPLKDLSLHYRPYPILVAVSLTLILTTAGLVYYGMQPPPYIPPPPPPPPQGFITIVGDANFSDTALLEGWPGDGSPENPYIIDGLDIEVVRGHIISISNTRVSFTISNCDLFGGCNGPRMPGAGIYLENVTNGELVNNNLHCLLSGIVLYGSSSNTVFNNTCIDIVLDYSDYNTVANNTGPYDCVDINLRFSDYNTVANNNCSSNWNHGISLESSDSNTVSNNICNGNGNHGISLESSYSNTVSNNICNNNNVNDEDFGDGISLYGSDSNTIEYNTCNSNRIGICLNDSDWNVVVNNACFSNTEYGIYLDDESGSNTVENNTFSSNTEHDIVYESELEELAHQEYVAKQSVWFLAGCGMILVVSVIAVVQFRRMEI